MFHSAGACTPAGAAVVAPELSAGGNGCRVKVPEGGTKGASAAMVKPVDGALRLSEPLGDLAGRESGYMSKYQNPSLVEGELAERVPERTAALGVRVLASVVAGAHFLEGDRTPRPYVVECGVSRDADDPRREGHLTLLIALDLDKELREERLGDVLGFMLVVDDASDVRADIVRESDVEEVQSGGVTFLGACDRLGEELGLPGPDSRLACESPIRQSGAAVVADVCRGCGAHILFREGRVRASAALTLLREHRGRTGVTTPVFAYAV
jgi:hypothetical protein